MVSAMSFQLNLAPWPSFSQREIDAVSEVLRSGNVNYWTGEHCRLFEKEFARFAGADYGVAVANGTVAIDLALIALGIGPGDEVVVTPRTFIASVSSIVNVGAKPVFADVDRDSQNITAATIQSVITPRTKAVICVHLAGWPCDMDPILALGEKYDFYVIEDCAQAHGALYKGRSVGSIGDIGCWSFCQDKIMTTGGEGGMVTTNSSEYWQRMWSYKDHGKSWAAVYEREHPPGFRWLHESFGTNWRLTEMQAAIGRIQLEYMDGWNAARLSNSNRIWDAASGNRNLRVPHVPSSIRHAGYKCYLFVENGYRDYYLNHLLQQGISCFTGSCSEVYLEKAFDNKNLRPSDRLPVANELGETSLMFPVHPTISKEYMNKVTAAIANLPKTKNEYSAD